MFSCFSRKMCSFYTTSICMFGSLIHNQTRRIAMNKPSFFFMPVNHFAGGRVAHYYPTFEAVQAALETLRRMALPPFSMMDTLVIAGTLEPITQPYFGWSAISMLSLTQKYRDPGMSMQDALLAQTEHFQNVLLVGPVFSFATLHAIVGKDQPSDEWLHAMAAMTETGVPYEVILQDGVHPVQGIRNLLTDEIALVCVPLVAPAFDHSLRVSPLTFFAGGDGAMG